MLIDPIFLIWWFFVTAVLVLSFLDTASWYDLFVLALFTFAMALALDGILTVVVECFGTAQEAGKPH
jgi:hypothetical protein